MDFSRVLLACFIAMLAWGARAPFSLAAGFQDQGLFEKANKLYYSEKYEEAAKIYGQLAGLHPALAAFKFNLGNADYRLGKTGPAILAYEKARLLDPRNEDIAKNLDYVRNRLEYRIEDKRNWYVRAGQKILGQFTEQEIALAAAAAFFLFMISVCLPLWLKGILPFGPVQKTLLALAVFTLLIFAAKCIEMRVMRGAIVMTGKAEVRFGPSEGDRVAFRLGEGLKVYVVDHRDGWSRILLTSGEDGWIKNSQIEEVL